jgi:hypothetical protein
MSAFEWDFSIGGKIPLEGTLLTDSLKRSYAPRPKGIGNATLKPDKVDLLRQVARRGYGIRATSHLTGISVHTVAKYYPREEDIRCRCGDSASHQGWCAWRVTESPKRLAFLQRWAYRHSGLLVSVTSTGMLTQAAAIVLRPSNIEGEMVTHIDVLNAVKRHAAGLDDVLREDLIQEMLLDVLENRTPLPELGRVIRAKVSAMRGEVSKFKFVSLDSIIPGTEDMRLIDTIESDRFHF